MASASSPWAAPLARSGSNMSSSERTIGRRRSFAASATGAVPMARAASFTKGGPDDDQEIQEEIVGSSVAGESDESGDHHQRDAHEPPPTTTRPPPLWRQMSDQAFVDSGNPEDGPRDYWRRPSPMLSPERAAPPLDSPWLRGAEQQLHEEDSQDDADGDSQGDQAEYSKRLEQVLALAGETPTESLTSNRPNGNHVRYDTDEYQAPGGAGYDDAVRDVLHGSESGVAVDDGEEEFGVLHPPVHGGTPARTPSVASLVGMDQSSMPASPSGPSRSYIHPSVSRLRSHQQRPRMSSSNSNMSLESAAPRQGRMPSQFSQVAISRSESSFTTSAVGPGVAPSGDGSPHKPDDVAERGPAFAFHPLRHLSAHLFNRAKNGVEVPSRPQSSRKASSVLGLSRSSNNDRPEAPTPPADGGLGKPTVMDVHGMLAVGTESGWAVVYGFGQEVRCVLGNDATVTSGQVTAITICPDQTYVGVGHANGNIFLYDLANPAKPARTQLALPLKSVLSGRKEGHLQGSRIIHLGFVGKRHTAIVTGDEHGRAFWFSLGRVMGVDSNDAVRMLGSYPERERLSEVPGSPGENGQGSAPSSVRSQPSKRPTTLFAALPLPLGGQPHTTDEFHFSALLTPVKLVVVGLKPSAKTWFRKMRDSTSGPSGGHVGCAAWLKPGEVATVAGADAAVSDPVLAYAWGSSVRFLRVRVNVTPPKDKKSDAIKTPEFVEGRRWDAPHPIHSLHWFDSDHVLLITAQEVILLNVRSMRPVEDTPLQTKLLTSQDFYSSLSLRKGQVAIPPAIDSSCKAYRGKLFLLTKANIQMGTLQHWNDRVLANVHRGDFLAAINLALAYYEGRAPGNTINLPDDPEGRRDVVGARVRELMRASLDWAFSEERMRDDTHFSADGRGVDLTSLFEGLATACIDACLAMGNMEFLFDDTYEHFASVGIQGIFLTRLEEYVFEGRIKEMPPNVVQALIAMHDDHEEYPQAEAVIWHIEPSSLDINQAVTLCEKRGLWDALIHVYTRAMGDFVTPIVKLISVVRDVQRQRRARPNLVGDDFEGEERLAPDAYKLYAYIASVLSGLWYPSGEAMREPEAIRARNAAYGFLFSSCNLYWPEGSTDPILTDQDEGLGEPAYPYLRLLLRFDTEAFLHAMDIAFEDSYLNDPGRAINRQSIINLMLDVMDTGFHSSDVTFLHIFVARNLPKYPQFIFLPPSTSHRILISLAADPDQSTREDRQLAAEYLLSAYTPNDWDEMLGRFEQAGFFRILRSAYRRDRKWPALVETLIKDPEADDTVFSSLDEIIGTAKSPTGIVAADVTSAIQDVLPQLFDLSVRQTARFLDQSLPTLHDTAIATLNGSEHKQVAYLRFLLDPSAEEGEGEAPDTEQPVSTHVHQAAKQKYVQLLGKHDPSAVVPFLDARGREFFNLKILAEQCEAAGLYEGQLWALDRDGQRKEAFETVDSVLAARGVDLAEGLQHASEGDVHMALSTLDSVAHMALRLCKEHTDADNADVEDLWFGVLHSITGLVHSISAFRPQAGDQVDSQLNATALDSLRGYVQDTLQALLSTSSPRLSFARLFKRLVEAAPSGAAPGSSPKQNKGGKKHRRHSSASGGGARAYSEFRAILTGMLDSFRADSEALALSIRLVEGDGFDLLEERVALASKGWRPQNANCARCHKPLFSRNSEGVDLRADGEGVHKACKEE